MRQIKCLCLILLLTFGYLSPTDLFSQERILKTTNEKFNSATSLWDPVRIFTQENNDAGQPLTARVRSRFNDSFVPEYLYDESWEYTEQGNVTSYSSVYQYLGQSQSYDKYLEESSYNLNQQLSEIIKYESFDIAEQIKPYEKITYSYDVVSKKETQTRFTNTQTPAIWQLERQTDLLHNQQGCLEKLTERHYDVATNMVILEIQTTYTRDDDCQISLVETHRRNTQQEPFSPYQKRESIYSDNGKIIHTDVYMYEQNAWRLYEIHELEKDEEDRVIRKHNDYLAGFMIKKFVSLYEFDESGRPTISQNFENDTLFSESRYTYEINGEGQVVSTTTIFENFFFNRVNTNTHFYDYYCSGSLKSDYHDVLPSNFRILYEYPIGTDCETQDKNPNVELYPSPNNGVFEINSTLLESQFATISVYSIHGKEVFSKPLPGLVDQHKLDISHLNNGTYLARITAGNITVSKKFTIVK